MKKLFLFSTACIFCSLTAYAQDPQPVAEVAQNSICLADTCLTGISAGIIAGFSILVTVATVLTKFFKDTTTWYGKILDKIANIKIKK